MNWLRSLRYVALAAGLAYALPTACGGGGVVGGECINPDCSPVSATGGKNGKPTGGSSGVDGGTTSNEGGNGATAAQAGDGELPDGGFFDSPIDGDMDADTPVECLPPHDSPSHCGDCETRCTGATPLCAPDGNGSFECVPKCEPPLVECQGQCVDPESFKSDPDNCGQCGNECPSDICQDGMCVGARFGHVALLCMDLGSAMTDSSPVTLLGNAVFIPPQNPVKVLAYTLGATPAAVNRINTLIGIAGDNRLRKAQITEAKMPMAVTSKLNVNDYQVLLIHDLDQAESGEPAAAATTWESASVLSSFVRAGGVIVVLDGSDGTGEMHELITAGKLLDPSLATTISGQDEITGQKVVTSAGGDLLAANLLQEFAAPARTCTFDTNATPNSEISFVVTSKDEGKPVAIHRVVAP